MIGRRMSSRGDTIVEVLIAIAVATAVVASAYGVVNHTLANARQAQEHSEALGLAQSQIEQLKSTTPAPTTPGTQYCFDNSTHALKSSACTGLGGGGFYTVYFQYYNPGLGQDYYRIYVVWPSAAGDGTDTVNLSYRLQ